MSLWNWSQRTVSLTVTALVMSVLAACGGGTPTAQPARAEIRAMLPQGLSAAEVTRVQVEVRGPGIPTPVVGELSLQGGTWQGTLVDIPAGLDRTFEAKAFNAAATLLYQGLAGPINVTSGSTVSVSIQLQDVNPPPVFENVAPVIDSVVVSSNQVSPGGTLTLTATAHDDNVGDTITYAWTANAGTFSAPNEPATSWVAPATEGVQVLRLEVTDSKGTKATVTIDISVQQSGATGSAVVTVGFNTWPAVTSMMAAPSVLTPNVTTTLAAAAFDADGDALSYSWFSECPGFFSDQVGATISFTLFGQPPGNRCVISIFVSDGRGGSNTGTLSLLVGPAPRANVAPQIVSTTKSSDQAAGGEIVLAGLIAHDPEATAMTFTWSANQGAILATRGTSTSTEVDWQAPACIDGTAVLTATITDAGGAITRQEFSISPRPGSACSGLAVTGVRNAYRVKSDGSITTVPVDLSAMSIGAWVPTADGLGYNWRPGTGQAGGTFVIPSVESTPFLLQLGTSYLWATSRTLDVSRAELGRPDVELEPQGTQLNLNINGLAPWQDSDDIQFHSPNTGIGYFSAVSCASPQFPSTVPGSTFLSGTIDYVLSLQNCGSPAARISPVHGDVLYVTQLASRTDAVTGLSYQELNRSFQTGSLGPPGAGVLDLFGAMSVLPTTSHIVDYPASSFEALALAAHPTATLSFTSVNLGILPAFMDFGGFAGWPDLALASRSAGQGHVMAEFTYGNPFPGTWAQFVTAQSSARVVYSVDLPGGGTSTPRPFTVYTYAQEPVSGGMISSLIPRIGPPRDMRLNGAVATESLAGVGLTPLASWVPPSMGVPDYYLVRVYELYATGTNATARAQLAVLRTTGTQLRLPPGLLQAGKFYHLQVTAIFAPGLDPNKPYVGKPTYHSAMAVTGRFQP
ncbi:MAG: hypothetical protein JXB05_12815 [Myxococcaceae bacterium]|nr:hypothetical protein [Myxococcaceae bacterium]